MSSEQTIDVWFNDHLVRESTVPMSLAKGELSLAWDYSPGDLYTVVVYNMGPASSSSYTSYPYAHLLVTNIPNNDFSAGSILLPFEPISVSMTGADGVNDIHVDVFLQPLGSIRPAPHSIRTRFDLRGFIKRHDLQPLASREFQVSGEEHKNSTTKKIPPLKKMAQVQPAQFQPSQYQPSLPIVIPARSGNSMAPLPTKRSPNNNEMVAYAPNGASYFKSGSNLTDQEQKYCRCTLHVAAKQSDECNKEKSWFETRGGTKCVNPWAVCASRVGTTTRRCGENYQYENIPDNELKAYAELSKITIPSPYNRTKMLNNIAEWKKSKGK